MSLVRAAENRVVRRMIVRTSQVAVNTSEGAHAQHSGEPASCDQHGQRHPVNPVVNAMATATTPAQVGELVNRRATEPEADRGPPAGPGSGNCSTQCDGAERHRSDRDARVAER